MQRGLEQRIVERWPQWFNTTGDVRRAAMPLGFQHEDGWFGILWKLWEDLEPVVARYEQATGNKFEILQVKEKFGGLRIATNHADDAIHGRIETAKQGSLRTCEVCGKTGTVRDGDWIKTLCDRHASAEQSEL